MPHNDLPQDIQSLTQRAEADSPTSEADLPPQEEAVLEVEHAEELVPTPELAEAPESEAKAQTPEAEQLQHDYDRLTQDKESPSEEKLGTQIKLLATKHWMLILLVIILILLSTQWSNKYNDKMRQIDRLEKQVKDLRRRQLFTTAELVRLQNIHSIEKAIEKQGLKLEHSAEPPYIVNPSKVEE